MNQIRSLQYKKQAEYLVGLVYQALASGLEYSEIKAVYKLSSDSLNDYLKLASCFEFKRLTSIQTLKLSHSIKSFMKVFKQKMTKALLYPIILVVIAIGLLFFYGFTFGPNLIVMLSGYTNTNDIKLEVAIVKIGAILALVVLIIVALFLVLLSMKDLGIMAYTVMCRYSIFDLFKESITYIFAVCLLFILKLEISTLDAVRELRSLKQLPYVSWLSYHIDQKLINGSTMMDALNSNYVSKSFSLLVVQGLISEDLVGSIERYCDLAVLAIETKIRRLGRGLKVFAYIAIVAIMALFYSSLFKPLKMLEGLL